MPRQSSRLRREPFKLEARVQSSHGVPLGLSAYAFSFPFIVLSPWGMEKNCPIPFLNIAGCQQRQLASLISWRSQVRVLPPQPQRQYKFYSNLMVLNLVSKTERLRFNSLVLSCFRKFNRLRFRRKQQSYTCNNINNNFHLVVLRFKF